MGRRVAGLVQLALQPRHHHALNEVTLRQEEERDNGQGHSGGCRQLQIPTDIRLAAERSQANRYREMVRRPQSR